MAQKNKISFGEKPWCLLFYYINLYFYKCVCNINIVYFNLLRRSQELRKYMLNLYDIASKIRNVAIFIDFNSILSKYLHIFMVNLAKIFAHLASMVYYWGMAIKSEGERVFSNVLYYIIRKYFLRNLILLQACTLIWGPYVSPLSFASQKLARPPCCCCGLQNTVCYRFGLSTRGTVFIPRFVKIGHMVQIWKTAVQANETGKFHFFLFGERK
jgi:hypothetical protein